MSTKNKPVPYIDAQTTSDSPAPVTRKVRFNPYTGGILSNANDKPAFGKYTMEIRSGSKFVSKFVNFRWKFANGVWSYITMQIPIPDVKLYVKNPNYDIMDSIVYLAIDEDALAGVDNGGNFDQTTRQATGSDYYISFSPEKSTPILKNTITLPLYDEIVRLFQRYTINEFLEKITGKSYSEETNSNTLVTLIQDNFHNLNLYAEAGFNNDSDSTADGYFIRNSLVTRFTFDKSYLDNPTLKSLNLRRDNSYIYLDIGCESLQSVTFNLYAGPDEIFDFDDTDELINTYTVNLANQKNPTVKIPITNIKAPAYNDLKAFQTYTELNNLTFGRKSVAVEITKVRVSAGIDVLDSQFLERFGTNPTTLRKISTSTTNIPSPFLATYDVATTLTKQPYLLDLQRNARKFYLKIELPLRGADLNDPLNLSGFLVRYINNTNTATNAMRFFSFKNSQVSLLNGRGQFNSGEEYIRYYYEIYDFFKAGGANGSSFTLDIPYAAQIQIYLVDNFYNVSTEPLILKPPIYNTTGYFGGLGAGFTFGGSYNLAPVGGFIIRNPRHTLQFIVQYHPAKPPKDNEKTPAVNSKLWATVPGGVVYTYSYTHFLGNILEPMKAGATLYANSAPVTGIDFSRIFIPAKYGQGYWLRLVLLDKYPTTLQKPNTGNILAVYRAYKT